MKWSGDMGRTVIPYIDNSNGRVASCGSFLRGKEEFGERGCREALEGADCGHSGFLKKILSGLDRVEGWVVVSRLKLLSSWCWSGSSWVLFSRSFGRWFWTLRDGALA